VWLWDSAPSAAEPGRWEPLDDPASGSESSSLSVGSLAVRFGATRATDQVVVGTGDSLLSFLGSDTVYGGIGIKISMQGGARHLGAGGASATAVLDNRARRASSSEKRGTNL
jgi:hypothetical protein